MALDEGDRGDQPRVDAERRGRVEHFRVRDALDVAHACAAGRRRPRVALGAHADHRRARHQEYEDGRDDLDQPSVPPGAAPASLLRVGQVEEAADPAPPPAALDRPGDAVEDPRRRAERPRHRRHRIAPATASRASRRPAAAALLRILLVLWASAAPRRARHRRPTPRPTWPHVPQPFGDPPRTVGTLRPCARRPRAASCRRAGRRASRPRPRPGARPSARPSGGRRRLGSGPSGGGGRLAGDLGARRPRLCHRLRGDVHHHRSAPGRSPWSHVRPDSSALRAPRRRAQAL